MVKTDGSFVQPVWTQTRFKRYTIVDSFYVVLLVVVACTSMGPCGPNWALRGVLLAARCNRRTADFTIVASSDVTPRRDPHTARSTSTRAPNHLCRSGSVRLAAREVKVEFFSATLTKSHSCCEGKGEGIGEVKQISVRTHNHSTRTQAQAAWCAFRKLV